MKVIDGKALAASLRAEIAKGVEELKTAMERMARFVAKVRGLRMLQHPVRGQDANHK